MATAALADFFEQISQGIKPISGVDASLEKAVKATFKYQHWDGGWVSMRDLHPQELSSNADYATAWQVQALADMKRTGLRIQKSDVNRTLRRSSQFICGTKYKGTIEMAGLGMNTLLIVNKIEFPLNAVDPFSVINYRIINNSTNWDTADLHGWLFYTQALITKGGDDWKAWNEKSLPLLLANQKPDGSWLRPSTLFVGTETDSTALCALMLESYYRVGQ
jgi:hypothetical protein